MAQPERGDDGRKRRRKTRVNSLRVRIIAACTQREVTPKEIAKQEKMPVATVNYHFHALEKEGYLHVSRKESVRGFQRHFYVADRQKVITDEEFAKMGAEEQHEVSEATLRDFLARCKEALKAGTMDARDDSHLTWSPLHLDEQGWKDMTGELSRAMERSFEIQEESLTRLRESGAEPIPTTFALAGFESPPSAAARSSSSGSK